MHDLVREHARALAAREVPGEDGDEATARLQDYYQHTAARAEALLARQARPATAEPASPEPAEGPALADAGQALAWARAERASLLACLDLATRTGQNARVSALTAGVYYLLCKSGNQVQNVKFIKD